MDPLRSNPLRNNSLLKLAGIFLVSTSLLLLSGCSQAQKAHQIIIAGSTSVQPFAEILAEEYMKMHPDISIDIQGGGSSSGIKAALSGTAAIGMSSRDLKGDELSLWSAEIARDGLAIIVHPDNTVNELSSAQVQDIYIKAVDNWAQLGGQDGNIHLFTREEGSGTRDAFVSLAMDNADVTPKAMVQDSNGAVRQLVGDDPGAIGYISLGLVNEQVKPVVLDGVTASHENIINGSYKLSRPFLFVSNGDPEGIAKDFIDFVLSEEGRQILTREGLVTRDAEVQS